jgi:quercetin dioxygenase-like cupin family protein
MKVAAAGKGFYERGDAEEFTGEVWLRKEPLAEDGTRMAAVHFSVGARTRWHVHPGGQLLVVLSGRGRVVPRGGKGEMLVPGDIVYAPPGKEHYHGAGPDSPMVHVALTIGGSATKWGLPVTDEEYGKDF